MLHSAAASIARHRLESPIALAHGLAEGVTPALFGLSAPIDHAIFSYSLSMIPDWRAAVRAAHGALAGEGRAHIVDFGDLRELSPFFANGLRRWLRLFHVTPREELLGRLEAGGGARPTGDLTVLSGRYAFLWHGDRGALGNLAGPPVAE
jgi:S-adenosylmethionine-diacylgycerolhomoserine-N-methlytransferase